MINFGRVDADLRRGGQKLTSKSAQTGIDDAYRFTLVLKGMAISRFDIFEYLGTSKVRNLGCGVHAETGAGYQCGGLVQEIQEDISGRR